MLENLWELSTKLKKETVCVGSGYWVEPFPWYQKNYFLCLLDYFSTSLFNKKINEQREIPDTLSSVCSEQLEGGTGEVSFNSCPAHHILAQQVTKILFKCAECNSFLPFKRKKSKKGSY